MLSKGEVGIYANAIFGPIVVGHIPKQRDAAYMRHARKHAIFASVAYARIDNVNQSTATACNSQGIFQVPLLPSSVSSHLKNNWLASCPAHLHDLASGRHQAIAQIAMPIDLYHPPRAGQGQPDDVRMQSWSDFVVEKTWGKKPGIETCT